jgi:threonylcarbamoyladenosine tRNA methylthiotransferase MtaB
MSLAEVLGTVSGIRNAGFQEAVLTGIHLGMWGRDLAPPSSLSALLEEIEARRSVARLRLSSIEPLEWTDDLVDRIAESRRFCRHFHMPLQSGDNGILKRMGRPYTREGFAERVMRIIDVVPGAAVGADVLVGFPGESDAAHEATFRLLSTLPVTYLHVFPFSPRGGTPAANYPDQVPPETVKARCRRLRRLGREKRLRFHRRHAGAVLDVVLESRRDRATGRLVGMSDNYIPVLVEGPDALMNTRQSIRVVRIDDSGTVFGAVVS